MCCTFIVTRNQWLHYFLPYPQNPPLILKKMKKNEQIRRQPNRMALLKSRPASHNQSLDHFTHSWRRRAAPALRSPRFASKKSQKTKYNHDDFAQLTLPLVPLARPAEMPLSLTTYPGWPDHRVTLATSQEQNSAVQHGQGDGRLPTELLSLNGRYSSGGNLCCMSGFVEQQSNAIA